MGSKYCSSRGRRVRWSSMAPCSCSAVNPRQPSGQYRASQHRPVSLDLIVLPLAVLPAWRAAGSSWLGAIVRRAANPAFTSALVSCTGSKRRLGARPGRTCQQGVWPQVNGVEMFWSQKSRFPAVCMQQCINRRNWKRFALLQVALCFPRRQPDQR